MTVNLSGITPLVASGSAKQQNGPAQVHSAENTFSKLFDEVNHLQLAADKKIDQFATSRNKDLHGTMIALQKADLSLRLFLQVRAKLTSAFQEIMRMQV